MADGMWTLRDDGTFELQEPYAGLLKEAKVTASTAWTAALIDYLEQHSCYTAEELRDELLARNGSEPGSLAMVDSFILEALGGDL